MLVFFINLNEDKINNIMAYFRRIFCVDDNSGAQFFKTFKVLRKPRKTKIVIGDKLVGSVQSVLLRKMKRKKKPTKKGIFEVVLVRDRKFIRRGSFFLFSKNSGVVLLIKETYLPLGNRILTPVFLELRLKGFLKILMLAKYIV